jgi:hypothetical protein
MEKFMTRCVYMPIVAEGTGFAYMDDENGKKISFKTRAAVEHFCKKERCMYVKKYLTFFK